MTLGRVAADRGDVPARRFVKVEKNREIVALTEFISNGIEDRLALGREAAQDEDDL